MADGGFRVEISESLGRQLVAAAEAAGRPVSDYAADLIARGLDDWAEDLARYEEYRRSGEYLDAETVLAGFRAELARRFRDKHK